MYFAGSLKTQASITQKKNGVKALQSNEFNDKDLAMSYYDSFKDHIKKQNLPVEVKIRKNNDGTAWKLFLIKREG